MAYVDGDESRFDRLRARSMSWVLAASIAVAAAGCKCSGSDAAPRPAASAAVADGAREASAVVARDLAREARKKAAAQPPPSAVPSAERVDAGADADADDEPPALIATGCRDPSVLLAVTDEKPIGDRSFPAVRELLSRQGGIHIVDDQPLAAGQVKLFVYDYGKAQWALVASCFEARSCNRLAAAFRTVDASVIETSCGPIPGTGAATSAHP